MALVERGKDYVMVSEQTVEELQTSVLALTGQNYRPLWGSVITGTSTGADGFYQAMYKEG